MKGKILTVIVVLSALMAHASDFEPYKKYWLYPSFDKSVRLDNANNRVAQGNKVGISANNNHLAQRWQIDTFKDGVILRTMSNPEFVLDNTNSRVAENNPVTIRQLNGQPNQIWLMESVGPDKYIFRSSQDPSYAMTLNQEGRIVLMRYSGWDSQQWIMEKAAPYINIERDQAGRIILAPHRFSYEAPEGMYDISFYPDDPEGECTVSFAERLPDGRIDNMFMGESATYTYDGKNISIKTREKGEVWTGTISDDGLTLTLRNGSKTRHYKIGA